MSTETIKRRKKRGHKVFHKIVESDLIRRVSYEEYRDKVHDVYSGPKGAMLAWCSTVSLHLPLGDRVFRRRKFDLHGARSILDIGSGAGQIAKSLLKYADPGADITCFDLSQKMLRRARTRMKSDAPSFVAADLGWMPFADGSFDCITCGYVLEHLPDPQTGLAEVARVLRRGGRMYLLATEDSFFGAFNSRIWHCQTYNRAELQKTCEALGLAWKKEIWFTPVHKTFRLGGICVEIQRQ